MEKVFVHNEIASHEPQAYDESAHQSVSSHLHEKTTDNNQLLQRILIVSTIALLHSPFIFWLRNLWFTSSLDEIVLSQFTPLTIAGLLYLRRTAVMKLVQPKDNANSRVGPILLLGSFLIAVTSVINGSILPLAISAPMGLHGYLAWTRGNDEVLPVLIPIYLLPFLVPGTYEELGTFSASLQYASAETATAMLQLVGFPSILDGITIVTDGTYNHVTEACSGMTTLTTLIVYAMVFGYILDLRLSSILVSLFSVLFLALMANASRIAIISYMLYVYGEEVANGPLHNGCGFVAFGIAYGLLFLLMRRLPKDPLLSSNPT